MKPIVKNILIYAAVLLFIAIFNSICFFGARDITTAYQAKDTAVTLQATISSSRVYSELDEGVERDYWHVYVTYTYDGVTYSDVYFDQARRAPEIGKLVTVQIDPENPGELLPDKIDIFLSLLLCPVFLTGVTIGVYFVANSIFKSIAEAMCKQDPIFTDKLALLFVGIKLVAESLVFYLRHDSLVFAIFSLIAAAVFGFFLLRKSKKKNEKAQCQKIA